MNTQRPQPVITSSEVQSNEEVVVHKSEEQAWSDFTTFALELARAQPKGRKPVSNPAPWWSEEYLDGDYDMVSANLRRHELGD